MPEFKEVVQEKILSSELEVGMYVTELDRPWVETPFAFQGFMIRNQSLIQELQKFCKFVLIDIERSITTPRKKPGAVTSVSTAEPIKESVFRNPKGHLVYPDTVTPEKEIFAARRTHKNALELMQTLAATVRLGEKLNTKQIDKVVDEMVDSIIRNPDAFMWLRNIKEKDAYIYNHSVNVSALAIAFGRYLGLPKNDLKSLAAAGLLFDAGKTKLPDELLEKPTGLTDEELVLMRKHVQFSVELMREIPGLCPETVEAVQHHHERFDGSGYPEGLTDDKISIFGKIIGIADCYDAATSNRCYKVSLCHHAAINDLYQGRGAMFHADLVEQFIQCLGVYPTGSLVELTSCEVGIVIAENRLRRLRPKLMLLLQANKEPYDSSPICDLETKLKGNDGCPLEIRRSVEPDEFGINPKEFFI